MNLKTRIECTVREAIAQCLQEQGGTIVTAREDCTLESLALWYSYHYSVDQIANDLPERRLRTKRYTTDCLGAMVRKFFGDKIVCVYFAVAPFTRELVVVNDDTTQALNRCILPDICDSQEDVLLFLNHTIDINTCQHPALK